jgi:DnaJ-class molecular chaperone
MYDNEDQLMHPCSACHGRGGDVDATCPDCGGSGYDPHEDNPFAQCHECYGEGVVTLDICPKCGGSGEVENDDDD